jgi:hypothetical protein
MSSQKYLSSTPGLFDNIMKGISTGVGAATSLTGLKMPSFGGTPAGSVPSSQSVNRTA